jgi:phosphoglycerate kinase
MPTRSIRDADVAGKRVFVRVDFNVPLDDNAISDDTRIRAALPTIQYLIEHGARIILCSHLGRPKGKPVDNLRLAPIGGRLSELLGCPVSTATDAIGPDAMGTVASLGNGDIALLENVRFEPGEERNDPALAASLADLADLYVNDAFGAAHRAHASTVGIAAHLPAFAGFLMDAEIGALQKVIDQPERPFIAILGGAKISDKLGVIENLLPKVDALLLGGGMANTFLLAQEKQIGKSLAEPDLTGKAAELIELAVNQNTELLLPSDAVVAPDLDAPAETVDIDTIPPDAAVFDIGLDTSHRYATTIASARTIFWNGPMGVFEHATFAAGTKTVAVAVADSNAFSVVGGGDSVAAIEQLDLADRISHISTGGGASLEYIEGRTLPGIIALERES